MPLAAGFVGIIPALKLLDEEKDGSRPVTLTWMSAVGWSCAIAYFGYVCLLNLNTSSHRIDYRSASSCPLLSEREWYVGLENILYWWTTSKSTDCRRGTRISIWNCDCQGNIGTSWNAFNKFRITTTAWIQPYSPRGTGPRNIIFT